MTLLDELNIDYMKVHADAEAAFWAAKMALSGFKEGDFEAKEGRRNDFRADAKRLMRVRRALERQDLTAEERTGLEGWRKFFEANAIESDEAKALQKRIVELEGLLANERRELELGYQDPHGKGFIKAGSTELGLKLSTEPDEAVRRAAFEGMTRIESFVLQSRFLDIVKERNRLARRLGYEDYYDYKVTVNEGFSKKKLFALLDELERDTREACERSVRELEKAHGKGVRKPWNFGFYTSGSITKQLDPYFNLADAVARWGRSFAALGIKYSGAHLRLDLIERDGKEENGFMHGPVPSLLKGGKFTPAAINFTSNAVPGQVGSGIDTLQTLFHEGGHAAHFANIRMPAPCYSQEFAPTSVAFAETQSMFLDSLVGDADWRQRYAKDSAGRSMPADLIKESIQKDHRFLAYSIRRMLEVCYAEKALYEMTDEERTPERVRAVVHEIEQRMRCLEASPRPILAVPHILAGEASAYYHGYVLAQMAVYQTREYFTKKYGHIVDNPHVGPELAHSYWEKGNAKTFLEFIEDLTGEPFSAKATVALVNKSAQEIDREVDTALGKEPSIPAHQGKIDLDARIDVVHGDQVIATSATGGFEALEQGWRAWTTSLAKS